MSVECWLTASSKYGLFEISCHTATLCFPPNISQHLYLSVSSLTPDYLNFSFFYKQCRIYLSKLPLIIILGNLCVTVTVPRKPNLLKMTCTKWYHGPGPMLNMSNSDMLTCQLNWQSAALLHNTEDIPNVRLTFTVSSFNVMW